MGIPFDLTSVDKIVAVPRCTAPSRISVKELLGRSRRRPAPNLSRANLDELMCRVMVKDLPK